MLKLNPINLYGQFSHNLGSGVTGNVEKYQKGNESYAIKIYNDNSCSIGVTYELLREIAILRRIQHKGIIRLIDIIPDDYPKMVMECGERTLNEYIFSSSITAEINESYIKQLIKGLNCLHENDIWHRDIKPQNIICFKDGRVCLADFGLAKSFSVKGFAYTGDIQSLWWRSPEILLGETHYGPEIDVFSLGIIFAELYVGQHLLPGDSEFDMLYKEVSLLGNFHEEKWPNITEYPNYNPCIIKWSKMHQNDNWDNKFKLRSIIYPKEYIIDIIREMTYPNPKARKTAKQIKMKLSKKDLNRSVDETETKRSNLETTSFFKFTNLETNYDLLFLYIHGKYSLRTFIYTHCLFERYLSRHIFYPELVKPSEDNLKNLIKACFIIAAKFIDIDILDLDSICENKGDVKLLNFYENQVLRALNYDLIFPTPFTELENLTKSIDNQKVFRLTSYYYIILYIFNSINEEQKLSYEEIGKTCFLVLNGENNEKTKHFGRIVNKYNILNTVQEIRKRI